MFDRRERRAGLLGSLVDQVKRDPGLHVDQGEVVSEHVVQLARDPQALLAGHSPLLLAASGDRLRTALLPYTNDLGNRAEQQHPRRDPRCPRQARCGLRPGGGHQHDEQQIATEDGQPSEPTLTGHHRSPERHNHSREHEAPGVVIGQGIAERDR